MEGAVRKTLAIGYVAAMLALMVLTGEPDALWWWLSALAFLALGCAPFLLGLWSIALLRGPVRGGYAVAVIAIATVGYALSCYVLLVGPPDAQNGLVMVFVPIYQGVAFGVAFLAAKLLERLVLKS